MQGVKDLRNKWSEINQTANTVPKAKFMISPTVNKRKGGSSGVINWPWVGCVPPSQQKHQNIAFNDESTSRKGHCTTICKTLPKMVPASLLFHIEKKSNLNSCGEKSS